MIYSTHCGFTQNTINELSRPTPYSFVCSSMQMVCEKSTIHTIVTNNAELKLYSVNNFHNVTNLEVFHFFCTFPGHVFRIYLIRNTLTPHDSYSNLKDKQQNLPNFPNTNVKLNYRKFTTFSFFGFPFIFFVCKIYFIRATNGKCAAVCRMKMILVNCWGCLRDECSAPDCITSGWKNRTKFIFWRLCVCVRVYAREKCAKVMALCRSMFIRIGYVKMRAFIFIVICYTIYVCVHSGKNEQNFRAVIRGLYFAWLLYIILCVCVNTENSMCAVHSEKENALRF